MEWFFNENFKMKQIKGISKSNFNSYTTLTEDITNLLKIHKIGDPNIKAKIMLEFLLPQCSILQKKCLIKKGGIIFRKY